MTNYDAIALQIVPTDRERGRIELRASIAKAMEAVVAQALEKQRNANFPEIQDLSAALRAREAQLRKAESAVAARETEVLRREARLKTVTAALEAYAAWLNGEGEVDENGPRFAALRQACLSFKENP